MGWVRIDDNFTDHPKVIGLSDSAFRSYVSSLCYSNRFLTDGLISELVLSRILVLQGDEKELIEAGLWSKNKVGICITSYGEYQPSKESVETKREASRLRMENNRARSSQEVRANKEGSSQEVTPTPTQPNPTQIKIKDLSILDDGFNDFWEIYPRGDGKLAAKKAWVKAIKKTDLQTIMDGVARYIHINSGKEPDWMAMASTWLNGERWNDEKPKPPTKTHQPPQFIPSDRPEGVPMPDDMRRSVLARRADSEGRTL